MPKRKFSTKPAFCEGANILKSPLTVYALECMMDIPVTIHNPAAAGTTALSERHPVESPTFSVDPQTLRNVMRHWATGVTVVSSTYEHIRHGMTVSSFTSVALDPPLVLVSLSQDTRTHGLIQKSGIFGVTILRQDQQVISERFAGRTADDGDRFHGLQVSILSTGAPFLANGLAFFDCKVVTAYPTGSHTLFIGRVVAVYNALEGTPLIYYDRAYYELKS
jgi:flavin reductase (DIM6/NTAB) family NADH-FMN oxidoreductase RutF